MSMLFFMVQPKQGKTRKTDMKRTNGRMSFCYQPLDKDHYRESYNQVFIYTVLKQLGVSTSKTTTRLFYVQTSEDKSFRNSNKKQKQYPVYFHSDV